ncbi:MAG: hypothetical protein E7277_02955 [Lachnospiraceae bacterium]|nr:hypothetical protein [Lachnospiraceae bacterium]
MKRMKMGILLLCVLLIVAGCKKKEPKVVIGTGGGMGPVATGDAKKQPDKLPLVFIYRGIMEDTDLMLFQKVNGSTQELAYHYTGGTKMYDRYGKPESLEQLTPGEVYALDIDVNTQTITEMKQSDAVWVFPELVRYQLDLEHEKIQIGEDAYHLGEMVPVFDGAEVFSSKQIGENDELTLIGFGKEILSVIISTGHGELQFKNIAGFEKGYFVLGNVAAARITKDETMSVRAGTYLLSVAGSGRGGSEEITIQPGKVTVVDLAKYKVGAKKECKLVFFAEQKGVTVTLNGVKVKLGKTMKVPYGIYRVKATKKGHDDWKKILFVNSKNAKISIDMGDKTGTTNANANNSKPTSGLAGSLSGTVAGSGQGTGTQNSGSKTGTTNSSNNTSNTSNTSNTNSSNNVSNMGGLVNEVMKILTDSGKTSGKNSDSQNSEETKENK